MVAPTTEVAVTASVSIIFRYVRVLILGQSGRLSLQQSNCKLPHKLQFIGIFQKKKAE